MENNDLLSTVWPDWQIVRRIGKGSYGAVYEAVRTDHSVESRAAIKIISIPESETELDSLRAEGLSEEDTRKYLEGIVNDFVGEIQLMESFKGVQNIVSAEDYKVVEKEGEPGFHIYIRMELLTPFNSYAAEKTLTEPEVIKLGLDICTALELCAKKNVIHRDIKPENIFVNQFGDFKLGDFGIARKLENVTNGMSQKGTYNYMAPEVEKGTGYDATVDIYSLGLVLYRLLNKNLLPFLTPDTQLNPGERTAAVRKRLDGETLSAPCEASAEMAAVILKACAYEPAKRYRSAEEMKRALNAVLSKTEKQEALAEEEDELNKTVSVRHAQVTDLNATSAVNPAPATWTTNPSDNGSRTEKEINLFGRNLKLPPTKTLAIIGAAVLVVILVIVLSAKGGKKDADTDLVAEENSTAVTTEPKAGEGEGTPGTTGETEIAATETPIDVSNLTPEELALAKESGLSLEELPEGLTPEELEKQKAEQEEAAVNDILKQAEELADGGDTVAAMALLQKAKEQTGENEKIDAALQSYAESYKEAAIQEADAAADKGDYATALTRIGEAKVVLKDDAELTAKAKDYEDRAVSEVTDDVDTLLEQGSVSEAEAVITAAQALFPDNSTLKAKQKEIEEKKNQIVYLFDYDPASVNGAYLCMMNNDTRRYYYWYDMWGNIPYAYDTGWKMQSDGKTYSKGMALTAMSGSTTTVYYNNLNNEFSRLVGKVAFEDKYSNRVDNAYFVNIYADGEEAASYTIRKNAAPVEIDVDIDHCSELMIELVQPSNDSSMDPNINLLEFGVKY